MSYYDEPIIVLIKETHSHDDYYEDDYGHECHTLSGKTTISVEEHSDILHALHSVGRIGEANADNPPYDQYEFILAYCKESKEIVPKDLRCWASEEAYQEVYVDGVKPEDFKKKQEESLAKEAEVQ